MLSQLVGQFLQSADGGDLLKGLQAQGLSQQQATQAVHATAEGAAQQTTSGGLGALAGMFGGSSGSTIATALGGLLGAMPGASGAMPGASGATPGLGAALGGLLGGAPGASGATPGLGAALGGLMGGAPGESGATGPGAPVGTGPLAGFIAPVSQFVAQKTGLAPAMAQLVVTAALPKLLSMLGGGAPSSPAPAQPAAPTAGGAMDLLGSLLK